jgi:ketol-acid reductoisomerase
MTQIAPFIIIGFGSQAKAWSLNLRDSGRMVRIALRENSPSRAKVEALGLEIVTIGPELSQYSDFALLIPDLEIPTFLEANAAWLKKESRLVYAHGHAPTRHGLEKKYPQFSHLLFAPKAIASELRFQYEIKGGIAACYSVEMALDKNEDKTFLFQLAGDLGVTSGPYEVTHDEETRADLLSEQAILCSLLSYGALHAYQILRKNGVGPELAYLECWWEVKLIADAMVSAGPADFFKLISPNALIGGEKAQQLFFDNGLHEWFNQLLKDINNGNFDNEVKQIDAHKMRAEIVARWKGEELQQTHERLIGTLRKEK